jgi:hypothetical protein
MPHDGGCVIIRFHLRPHSYEDVLAKMTRSAGRTRPRGSKVGIWAELIEEMEAPAGTPRRCYGAVERLFA